MSAPSTTHNATPTPLLAESLRLLRAVWHVLQVSILLYGVGMSAYVLTFAALGERWPWIAFANNFLPWWALGAALAAVIALVTRWRWLLVAVQIPVLIAFAVLYGDLLLPPGSTADAGGPTFTAATYNIIASVSDPQAVTDNIATFDADIVGLQEVGPAHSAQLERDLAEEYPFQAHYPELPVHGVSLLSRYPITRAEPFRPFANSMRYLRAEIDLDGVPLVVYVVHPPTPSRVMIPTAYDTQRRDAEIEILRRDYLAHESGPVIVLGDFNMVDLSDAYRAMDADFDDAFRTAGRGLGFTFPAVESWELFPRMLRIDYVWYNRGVVARDARVGDDSGTSDHLPVIAVLALTQDSAF